VKMVIEAEKENGGLLAVQLFLLMLLLQLALRFLAPFIAPGKKRVSAKESELVNEIKQLYRDADALSMPATFAKSSKLRRAAVAKEKELALLKSSSGIDYSWVARQLSPSLLLKGIIILGLGGWFRHTSVASVPASLLQPFGGMLAKRGSLQGDSTLLNVSMMPWLVLSTQVASYLVANVWQRR